MARRGAFIVLEGLDRSGKSTQCSRLVDNLNAQGISAKGIRFPDRTTTTGKIIDAYLRQSAEMDDHAIHLLFAVNRWEKALMIRNEIQAGTTVICDRYAFSGAAFSAAKGLDYAWCKTPDVGLPAPDLTLFLSVSPEVAAQRGGFGIERYESNDMQARVRALFKGVAEEVGSARWMEIDADATMAAVEQVIFAAASRKCLSQDLSDGLSDLWK